MSTITSKVLNRFEHKYIIYIGDIFYVKLRKSHHFESYLYSIHLKYTNIELYSDIYNLCQVQEKVYLLSSFYNIELKDKDKLYLETCLYNIVNDYM